MRFKRPQVRYADTPQPATPYQAAAQVWDDRIGSARVQAKNWRLMAFGCLVLALLMAGGLVWRSAQSIVTPYVIEVDQAGQVRAVGEAATPYRPGDAQIAHHLARFVTLVRSLSIDPIVVRQNWLDAYDYTTDKGAAVLNDYARTNDPFARIGKESVTVQITSVVRATRLSTCAGQSSAMSTVRPPAPNAGTPCFRPSCKPRVLNSACSRTHWVSTSTACHGAANWILPKEQTMKLRFRLYVVPRGLRLAGKPPPSISLDETVLAQPLPEPPKPVEVVAVPEPLALPAQLKPCRNSMRPRCAGAGRRKGARFPCQCRSAYRAYP